MPHLSQHNVSPRATRVLRGRSAQRRPSQLAEARWAALMACLCKGAPRTSVTLAHASKACCLLEMLQNERTYFSTFYTRSSHITVAQRVAAAVRLARSRDHGPCVGECTTTTYCSAREPGSDRRFSFAKTKNKKGERVPSGPCIKAVRERGEFATPHAVCLCVETDTISITNTDHD